MIKNGKISNYFLNLALMVGSICMLFFALELVWQSFQLGAGNTWVFLRKDGYFKFNPETRHHLTSNYSINENGFRGKPFLVQKPLGFYRIVTLGASSTFGYENKNDGTYPFLLEKSFPPEDSVEVINAGIPYITSSEILQLFKKEILAMSPDLVTLYMGWNDADQAVYQLNLVTSFIRWLRRNSEFMSLLHFRLVNFMEAHPALPKGIPQLNAEEVSEAIERGILLFDKNIREIIKISRQNNIKVLLISQNARPPKYGGLNLDKIRKAPFNERRKFIGDFLMENQNLHFFNAIFYIQGFLQDHLVKIAAEEQVPFLDGIGALDTNPEFLVSHVHVSEKGNQILASLIHNKVEELLKQ